MTLTAFWFQTRTMSVGSFARTGAGMSIAAATSMVEAKPPNDRRIKA
jgi:hypothetical protein